MVIGLWSITKIIKCQPCGLLDVSSFPALSLSLPNVAVDIENPHIAHKRISLLEHPCWAIDTTSLLSIEADHPECSICFLQLTKML